MDANGMATSAVLIVLLADTGMHHWNRVSAHLEHCPGQGCNKTRRLHRSSQCTKPLTQ